MEYRRRPRRHTATTGVCKIHCVAIEGWFEINTIFLMDSHFRLYDGNFRIDSDGDEKNRSRKGKLIERRCCDAIRILFSAVFLHFSKNVNDFSVYSVWKYGIIAKTTTKNHNLLLTECNFPLLWNMATVRNPEKPVDFLLIFLWEDCGGTHFRFYERLYFYFSLINRKYIENKSRKADY